MSLYNSGTLARAPTSTVTSGPTDPTTPAFTSTLDWLTAYLTIHSLSANSYVYMYLLWLAALAAFLALCAATWSGVRGGALGAYWQRWALRRRTWRKKHTLRRAEEDARRKGLPPGASHRQPIALPSNAQLLSAFVLFVVVIVLCFIGPDYVNPDLPFSFSTSASTGKKRRDVTTESLEAFIPHYTISKAFWTSAARTGGIAFALFPLVIMFALKAPPFALLAIPGLVGYAHDKTIRLHRYAGRLIWLVTTLHVALWVVQACRDRRADTGELAIAYVWQYPKFRYAWIAYVAMTLLVVSSLQIVRTHHYEIFYFAHLVLTPVTIAFAALHHPQRGLWIWCAAALALWIGERLWRSIWWIYMNGIFQPGRRKGILVPMNNRFPNKQDASTVYPYMYSPGQDDAATRPASSTVTESSYGAHRAMLSASSAATLTEPLGPSALKYTKDKEKGEDSDAEEWEMVPVHDSPKRTSTVRLLSPPGQATDGRPVDSDRASMLSIESSYSAASTAESGLLPYMRSSTSTVMSPPSPPSAYRPAANLHTASVENSLDALNMRLANAETMNSSRATTPTPVNTPGPAPSPGELLDLARQESGGTLRGSRGVPLQIDIADASPYSIAPRTPINTFSYQYRDQSPGAGPGPRSSQSASYVSFTQKNASRPSPSAAPYAPPPGYALATLLPGRTVRLRLVTPGYQTWAPGQHFLVTIPAISRFASHPFSAASVCDEQAAARAQNVGAQLGGGRELVLLIRAKKGWTKRLWELVSRLQSAGRAQSPGVAVSPGSSDALPLPEPGRGAVLRVLVDGPFGSAARTHWGRYASVLVIAGGSGAAFGLGVLEYLCLCLAGRDGRFLGGHPGGWGVGPRGAWVTQRVRFVWLVREFAHIQWCASALHRCLQVIPTDALEISIFVTNFRIPKELGTPLTPLASPLSALSSNSNSANSAANSSGLRPDLLEPPHPRFVTAGAGAGIGPKKQVQKKPRPQSLALSDESDASDVSVDSIVDLYYLGLEDTPSDSGGPSHRSLSAPADDQGHISDQVDGHGNLEEDLGHETHVLDYTNFDGDDDTPLPGENRLSRKLIKEGRMRRAKSRRVTKAFEAKQVLERKVMRGKSPPPPSTSTPSGAPPRTSEDERSKRYSRRASSMLSTEPLLAGAGGLSPLAPLTPSSPLPHTPASASTPTLGGSSSGNGNVGVRWAENVGDPRGRESLFTLGESTGGDGLVLDAQEARDLQAVSEWARPGKPKLARILADEVEAAKGRVAVACCGPTSLNALMRKLIAAQIDPVRVARGDLRGSIDFIAEDFEY